MTKEGLSILIPIYNEQDSISGTIQQIKDNLKDVLFEWELICINDGSKDDSKEVLDRQDGIQVINHKVNQGYGAALKSGLRASRFDAICITDADGTYPNDRIQDMYISYRKDKLDMLVGARNGDDVSYPFIKKIPKFFIIKLANYISNYKIPDINSGLRVFNRDVAMNYIHLYPNGFSFTTTITMGMLCDYQNVDYTPINYYKRAGKSKIHPWKDTVGFFRLLIKISLYFNPFKFFAPIIYLSLVFSTYFLVRDIFYLKDLTQGSLFFPIITLFFFTLGLIADLIIKRSH
jgi:glycosyltransferase involved in cell wall biosynthesis